MKSSTKRNLVYEDSVTEILHHYLSRSRVIMRMRSGSALNCLMQRDRYCLGAPSCCPANVKPSEMKQDLSQSAHAEYRSSLIGCNNSSVNSVTSRSIPLFFSL